MKLHESVTNWKAIKSFSTLEERFNKLYNSIYDYSKSVYTNSRGKLIIICKTHGEFTKTPDEHLSGQGCPTCSREKLANKKRFTTNDFINKAKLVHGNKYDYSKVKYIQNKKHVIIVCPVHGEFKQTPHIHTKGSGCVKCKNESLTDDTKTFISKARAIHGNTYSYDNVIYTKSWNKVLITCSNCGDFEQTPNNHLSGKGCKICSGYGFDSKLPALLYYLKVTYDNQEFYKIGITNRTIQERFGSDMKYIQVLHKIHYKFGQDAYNEEQRILKQFKDFKYIGPDILKSGNTELFIKDILNA